MKNNIKKTTYDILLEIVAIAALLGSFYPLLFYNTIDSDVLIPVHYNFLGEADSWGGRSALWHMPLLGLTLYIGLSILQKYPEIYNYPCKVTKKNVNYIYRMGVRLVMHFKVLGLLLLAYINNSSYAAVIGKNFGQSNYVIIFFIMGLLFLGVFFIFKMIFYKPKG
jgi:hypothetical protein